MNKCPVSPSALGCLKHTRVMTARSDRKQKEEAWCLSVKLPRSPSANKACDFGFLWSLMQSACSIRLHSVCLKLGDRSPKASEFEKEPKDPNEFETEVVACH